MNKPLRNSIKLLVRSFYDYQDERLSLDGRIGRKKDGSAKKNCPEFDESLLVYLIKRREEIVEMENQLSKDIAVLVHKHPLWKVFLKDVKGCGEMMAAVMISEFDIHKAKHVSNLWSFAGLATGETFGKKKKGEKIITTDVRVKVDKKTIGFLCPFNQFLRSKLCGVLGSGFLKCNSSYRTFYDNMKHRLEMKDWGMESKNPTDKNRPKAGHQHKAANRYMIKMFLRDLYVAWRTIEGLPVSEPYQEKYLGHKHIEEAKDYSLIEEVA